MCFNFSPVDPTSFDWGEHFGSPTSEEPPAKKQKYEVEFADIGCGYGGLLGKHNLITGSKYAFVFLAC